MSLVRCSLLVALTSTACGAASPQPRPAPVTEAPVAPVATATSATDTPAPATPAKLPVVEDEGDDGSLAPTVSNAQKDDVQKVMRGASDAFVSCFREARKRNEAVSGVMVAKFVLNKTGMVTNTAFERGKNLVEDAAMESCISTVVQTLAFPPLRGGIATVRYPLRFNMK